MLWREPIFLWLLIAVVAVALLLLLSLRRRESALRAFAEASLLGHLAPGVDRRRRRFRIVLRVFAWSLLVLALAGPKWGFRWEEVRREGIDLVVAVDTSRSMLAVDVKPNRLERAKLAVLDLVQLLDGDRIGLVAFAGTAFLECPLTLDYAAFERTLRALEPGIIPRGGTSLSRAIDTSIEAFEARQGKYEALVLITDGEDHEGEAEEAARRAAERGIKIYSVGIGTPEGELIPLDAEQGEGFVKDRRGQVVKSKLNEEQLQQIASITGGAYVRGLGAALGLDEVFREHIAKMERREVASTLERRYEERFQIPLALALLLLMLDWLMSDRKMEDTARSRWRLRRWAASGAVPVTSERVKMTLLLFSLMPVLVGWFDPPGDRAAEGNRLYEAGQYPKAAQTYGEGLVDAPASPLLQFNLAAALYKQGKYAEAAQALEKVLATGDPEWVARAAYNLGNVHYRLGANAEQSEPQAAIASYNQALAFYRRAMGADPQDPDPKFNHELVARKLQELKKRLEEQAQEQEQEQSEQKPQPEQSEQQESSAQNEQSPPTEQQEGPEEEPPAAEEGAGEQTEQQTAEQQKQEQPQPGAASSEPPGEEAAQHDEPGQGQGASSEEPAQSASEQAAQAVLDTARSEEIGPEEIQRPAGRGLLGEPLQDW